MKNVIIVLSILSTIFFLSACHDHDDDTVYEVTINIVKPSSGASVTKGVLMPIEVNFSRPDKTIHNVLIQILDSNNSVVETILDKHAHVTSTFTYNESAAYKPTTSGTFKLKATTTDDNKNQPNVKEVTFTVN